MARLIIFPLIKKQSFPFFFLIVSVFLQIKKEPMIWDKIEQFLDLIPVFSDAKKQNRYYTDYLYNLFTQLIHNYIKKYIHIFNFNYQ